jgi:hypothetical protein
VLKALRLVACEPSLEYAATLQRQYLASHSVHMSLAYRPARVLPMPWSSSSTLLLHLVVPRTRVQPWKCFWNII